MKGQMEMIGVVFVVVFIVLGLLLYVSFSAINPEKLPAKQIRSAEMYAKSLQTAMLETTIPQCRDSLEHVLIECRQDADSRCGDGVKSCKHAHEAWEEMLVSILGDAGFDEGLTYSAVILLNNAVFMPNFQEFKKEPYLECNENSLAYAAPRVLLPTRTENLEFVIRLC